MKVEPVPLAPYVELSVLKSKFDKPIKAIGFVDTGTAFTMINPHILPGCWKEDEQHFLAANGKPFTTQYISKQPI
ncbi:hypothetical protein, partial [Vibrio vulnificus]|uniref:hypothetical protein n=1 Tax=Vibrio vulnificus TaxID=672 RepID=UPI0019D4E116